MTRRTGVCRALLSGVMLLSAICAVRGTEPRDVLAKRLELRFSPGDYEKAAISPDGRYLAYTKRNKGELFVYVVPTADPGRLLGKVRVGTSETSVRVVPIYTPSEVPLPPEVVSLGWAGDRVVVYTNLCVRRAGLSGVVYTAPGALMAFDPDGARAKILTTAADYPSLGKYRVLDERHVIVPYRQTQSVMLNRIPVLNPFIGRDRWREDHQFPRANLPTVYNREFSPDGLVHTGRLAVPYRVGYDYYTIDVVTGRECESDLRSRNAAGARALRASSLRKSAFAHCGDILRQLMAGESITPLDVHAGTELVALRADSTADPGRFYLFSQVRRKLYEIGRCQTAIDPAGYRVTGWTATFDGKAAHELMVAPAAGSVRSLGAIVMATDSKGANADPGYQREAMAVADMGYTVLILGVPSKTDVRREFEFDRAVETQVRAAFPGFGDDPVPVVLLAQTRVANFLYRLPFVSPSLYTGVVFLEPPRPRLPNPAYVLGSGDRVAEVSASAVREGPIGTGLCFHWADRVDGWRPIPVNGPAARRFCEGLRSLGIEFSYTAVNPVAIGLGEPKALADQYLRIDGFLKSAPRPGAVKFGPTRTVKLSAAIGRGASS